MLNIIYYIVCNCITKKIKNNFEITYKTDIVYVSRKVIRIYRIKDIITLESSCDKEGNLKESLKVYNIGTIQIVGKDNKISFDMSILEFTIGKIFN